MFEVTKEASIMIKELLAKQETAKATQVVRVLLQDGCCVGPSLDMVLDEPQESDVTFNDQGITFVMEKELFDMVKPIRVDFIESGLGSGFRFI